MADGTDIYIISGRKRSNAIRGPYIPDDLTADSQPDFDNWGPDSYWSCAAFQQWYVLMEAKYGAAYAKPKFLSAYDTAWTFGSYHQGCCWDSNFRNFFKSKDIDLDTLFCSLVKPIFDSAGNLVDTVSNTSEGVKNTSSVFKVLLPFAFIGVSIWAVDRFVVPIFPRNGNKR